MIFPKTNKFTYIIGNNGSGKSRALQENAERLCNTQKVVVIASGVSDKFKFRSQLKNTGNGYYRYMGNRTVGNGTHNGTLAANSVLLFLEVLKKELSVGFMNFLALIDFDMKIDISYRKTKFSKIKPFSTQELTSNFAISNNDILTAKERPFETVFYKKGTPYHFSELSSGEQYIITTALKIVASIEYNVCYFIDEPEVSLHVEWQIKWPEIFHPLLSLKDEVICYIATHSPVIISSALKAKSDCYTLLNNTLFKIQEQEFNVERILFKSFNTLTPDNKYIFEELASIVTRVVDHISGEIPEELEEGVTPFTPLASVEKFKQELILASRTDEDSEFIQSTLDDFEMAIKDLIAMPKRDGVKANSSGGTK